MTNENTPLPGVSDAHDSAAAEIGHKSGNVGWGTPPAPTVEAWPTEAVADVNVIKYPIKYIGQTETEEPEAFRMRRNAEIEFWNNSKQTAIDAVIVEKDHRAKVTATCFPNARKGTQYYELGNGFKVKLIQPFSYSIGNKDAVDEGTGQKITIREQVAALEAKVAELGDAHRIVFETIVSWKPEVSGSAYEKVNASDPIALEVRNMIDELLTISPGSPQLSFELPKEPK